MYTVTAYLDTRFNPVNIPYDPSVLTSAASEIIKLQSIDVTQNYFLTSISVSGSGVAGSFWDKIKLADYIKVGSFYYFVTSVKMTSPDVALLSIVPDYFTSARALGALHSLGGITKRWRVPESEDAFGKYTNQDDLLAPSETLVLVTDDSMFGKNDNLTDKHDDVYVESLIDLAKIQEDFSQDSSGNWVYKGAEGTTFTDPTDEENKVTVPYVPVPSTYTRYTCNGVELPLRGTTLYFVSAVDQALGLCHSLGIESGIIKEFGIPENFVGVSSRDSKTVAGMVGASKIDVTHLPLEYAKVKNKRVLYGDYNSFGILTASGASFEVNPELIVGYSGACPRIRMISDPRPDGAPYFRFEFYNGDASDEGFWRNAVRGAEWIEHPIRYTGASGEWRSTVKIAGELGLKQFHQNMQTTSTVRRGVDSALNVVGDVAGSLASYSLGANRVNNYFGNDYLSRVQDQQYSGYRSQGNALVGLGKAGVSTAESVGDQITSNLEFQYAKNVELSNFAMDQAVVAPTMQFIPNNNIVRDMYGNCIIPYRYHYSSTDLKRIDTLLTMYGYAVNKPFTFDMLTHHDDFEYIELSSIQLYGDDIPTWWSNGIISQLNTGVRIWHVKPDVKYFDSGLSYEIDDKQS